MFRQLGDDHGEGGFVDYAADGGRGVEFGAGGAEAGGVLGCCVERYGEDFACG